MKDIYEDFVDLAYMNYSKLNISNRHWKLWTEEELKDKFEEFIFQLKAHFPRTLSFSFSDSGMIMEMECWNCGKEIEYNVYSVSVNGERAGRLCVSCVKKISEHPELLNGAYTLENLPDIEDIFGLTVSEYCDMLIYDIFKELELGFPGDIIVERFKEKFSKVVDLYDEQFKHYVY